MKKIKLFEMFAGYGGCSFALKKANIDFECVGFSEINKFAIKCYLQNHKDIKNYGDCSKIDVNELPDFDLLSGGFPCQDVSMAGNRDLSKGRTNLYLEVLRIAKAKQPKYMLLENVKGLLSMGKSEKIDKNNLLIDKIIRDLKAINYGVCVKCLNSTEFNIPQNRERVWFVCKLGGWDFMEFNFPNSVPPTIFVKDILENEVNEKYYLSDESINKIKNRCRFGDHLYSDIPKTSNTLCHIGQSDVPRITIYDVSFNKIKKCSDVFSSNNLETEGLQTVIVPKTSEHYDMKKSFRVRILTPKECFRLMGFFDDEINLSNISDSQLYKLAGNGWALRPATDILKNMFKSEMIENIYSK